LRASSSASELGLASRGARPVSSWAVRVLLLTLLLAACQTPDGARGPDLELTPSVLPNLGLALTGSVPLQVGRSGEARLEARFTDQFLDDKNIAPNGDPRAGDWTQLDLGVRWNQHGERRFWTLRAGLTGFRARGEPNLIDEPGRYVGVYAGVGRRTWLGEHLAFGPELTLIAAHGDDPRVLVPQITWGVLWCP
jgi:hypothetical protein